MGETEQMREKAWLALGWLGWLGWLVDSEGDESGVSHKPSTDSLLPCRGGLAEIKQTHYYAHANLPHRHLLRT